jgi:HopA1 effector protein family
MKNDILNTLKQIVADIDITSQRHVIFHNTNQMKAAFDTPTAVVSDAMLSSVLQNLVYAHFYTQSQHIDTSKDTKILKSHNEYFTILEKANPSQERWDKDWKIDSVDYQAQHIIVSKGGYRRQIIAGEFVKQDFSQPLKEGTSVNIFLRKSNNEMEGGFYHVFGNTLTDDDARQIVRFYFHLKESGSPILINTLCSTLNEYQIPFHFKCLNTPAFYQRADAGVLYIDKRYHSIVADLIIQTYPSVSKHLNDTVPLFTLKLGRGIGFAENPLNPNDSFGTHRSRLISQSIIECFEQEKSKSEWLKAIEMTFEKNRISLEKPYLNPFSNYPYLFDTWKQLN